MKVEEIIKNKRDNLDIEEVPIESWGKIRSAWKKEESKSSIQWWRIAAMIFILFTAGLLFYSISLQNKVNELASLGDISAEYAEMELEYKNQIQTLEASLPLNDETTKVDFDWILKEMQALEEINQLYRNDIGRVPDQQELVRALVDYYEKKIKLLRKLELEINRTNKNNKNETDNHTTISI